MQNPGRDFISHVSFLPVTTKSSAVSDFTAYIRKYVTRLRGDLLLVLSLTVSDSVVTLLKILLNNSGEKESYLNSKYVCGNAFVLY
jgi:hypothetical protein